MNNRPCFVVPYFGRFPNNFSYWLNCCRQNREFYWLIFTDDKSTYNYPPNVMVNYISFQNLKKRFEKKLGFETALNSPYKLCDFRPLYGYLFENDLKSYTHFGWCDVDLLFGNLSSFITEDILNSYEKVSVLGHMSLMKNNYECKIMFTHCDYKTILIDSGVRTFDELYFSPNINEIIRNQKKKILVTFPYDDIYYDSFKFVSYQYISGNKTQRVKNYPTIYCRIDGKIYKVQFKQGVLDRKEIAYVHFQKRKIRVPMEQYVNYALIPNALVYISGWDDITPTYVLKNSRRNIRYDLRQKVHHIKRKIKN